MLTGKLRGRRGIVLELARRVGDEAGYTGSRCLYIVGLQREADALAERAEERVQHVLSDEARPT